MSNEHLGSLWRIYPSLLGEFTVRVCQGCRGGHRWPIRFSGLFDLLAKETDLKRFFSLSAALLIAVSIPLAPLFAEEQGDMPAKMAMGAAATISTVQAIDQETRKVTLRDPEGNLTTFTAGPEVRNLAQVKQGDIVLMEFYQGFAYVVEPATSASPGAGRYDWGCPRGRWERSRVRASPRLSM